MSWSIESGDNSMTWSLLFKIESILDEGRTGLKSRSSDSRLNVLYPLSYGFIPRLTPDHNEMDLAFFSISKAWAHGHSFDLM